MPPRTPAPIRLAAWSPRAPSSALRPRGPRWIVAALALVALVSGCVAGGPAGPSGSPGPSASPAPSTDLYLRAWTTQAVAPQAAFLTGTRLLIADGLVYDTAVAIPAIYPGPLLVQPFVRSISAHGIAAVKDALSSQGLLASEDFTEGIAPGGVTARLELVVEGRRYKLSGDPAPLIRCGGSARCMPDPGTAAAFAVFWQQLDDLSGWLGTDLGTEASYEPERLAVLTIPPVDAVAGIGAGSETWPLGTFSAFGSEYAGGRCAAISGVDLGKLLPLVRRSNAITRFTDSSGAVRSLLVRVLLPGEPDPCKGEAAGATATPKPIVSPAPSASGVAASPGATPGASAGSAGGLGLPTVVGLACFGSGFVFQASALTGPANAEEGTDAAAEALRTLLTTAGLDTAGLPPKGWIRVAASGAEVLFLARAASGDRWVSVSVTPVPGSTSWKAAGWGDCQPMARLASPFGAATWSLEASVSPETTSFTALVSESACASGQPAAGRISEPLVEYGDRTAAVTFGVVPLGGAQTCPLGPPSPVEVTLREPLGDRQLVDGAVYPPKAVEVSNPN